MSNPLGERVKLTLKLWTQTKKAADRAAKTELKKLKKEARGDKEEQAEIKQLSKNYDALKKKFKLGLSAMLKKAFNTKDDKEQVRFATEAKATVIKYIAAVNKYQTKHTLDAEGRIKMSPVVVPDPKNTIVCLLAALEKINDGLDKSIGFANKLNK